MRWYSAVGIVLVSMLGGCLLTDRIDERRLREFCAALKPGETVAEVRARVETRFAFGATGDVAIDGATRFLVHSSLSFGRHTCAVAHDQGRVLEGYYSYLD